MSKVSLRTLLLQQQVQAPGIFDCMSGRAAELVGYKAAYLSNTGIAYSWAGVPDIGIINPEEMFWIASRVTDYIPMPVIAGIQTASANPLDTYRQVQRLIKAGVSAFIIDDTTGHCGVDSLQIDIAPENEWLGKVKAAKAACENSECLVIARTWAKAELGLDAAIERCARAQKLGADLTSIVGMKTLQEANQMAQKVTGMKMWSNLGVTDGRSDVEPAEIEVLNFRLITLHYAEKGAMFGMLDFAKENEKNGNTVYHDTHDYDGMLDGQDYHTLFNFHKKWIPMEDEFMDVDELADGPVW